CRVVNPATTACYCYIKMSWGNCSVKMSSPMETFTMSRKELPRAGLVQAALTGKITNREGAAALQISPRQFQRLKERFRDGGAPGLRHRGRGRLSHRRLPVSTAGQMQALLSGVYKGFNDTHATEKLREVEAIAIS